VGCIVAGVSEPAIYGVNLKYKKPMAGVMAGGFAGGFVASLLGAKVYIMGYSNLIALPIFQKTVGAALAGVIVAIVVAFAVSFILGIENGKKVPLTKPVEKIYGDDEIIAIADGNMIPLADVKDEAFASKALGDGVAFELSNGFVTAPANGELSVLFPTGHAFGITTKEGVEILVHIGIDTVNLKGEGFDVLAKQGDNVRAGQPIVKVDMDLIKKKGYDLTTMLIITQPNGKTITFNEYGMKKQGDIINNK
jgi:PTS system beta-glucosides-specific IIC component